MIIKQPHADNDKRPEEVATDDARMTYFWTWFNVLTMGLVDALDDNAVDYDEEELTGKEAAPERNKKTLEGALKCLKMMQAAALAFVKQDRKENGWSQNIGLFFHCYPHCSVNSTHMHIVDLDFTGPTFDKINYEEGRNLRMDDVIEAVEEEIEHLENELRPRVKRVSRVLAVGWGPG